MRQWVVLMNIDASHVSVDGLRINSDISDLLNKYSIKNYSDLRKEMDNNNGEIINNYFLRTAYFEFQKSVSSQSLAESVYQDHLKLDSKRKSLNLKNLDVDKMVRVTDLPLFVSQPGLLYSAIYGFKRYRREEVSELNKYSIEYLKRKMTKCIIKDGEAIPEIIYYSSSIGEVKYNQILASIYFYDKYVESLLEKYPEQENPFYYMYDEKLLLVREKREAIFNYLNNMGYELVVGDLSKIMGFLDASRPTSVLKKRIFAIEEVIAKYVTFDEAINIDSPKVLNKFIVPYGKK